MNPIRFLLILLVSLVSFCTNGNCQLTADFQSNVESGCAPLAVNFENLSSGISEKASFLWDFGNGNTSILKNPGAVFQQPSTYKVRLTITDGGKTSVSTKEIIVYNNPDVEFNASVIKGCSPLLVKFSSQSRPGDGDIDNYIWGFGDGEVSENTTEEITHTYSQSTKAGVSLTVTNSFGCRTTFLKKDMINVLPVMKAAFVPRDSFLCKITDEAAFLNKSSGPGKLTYLWDFGDGSTSQEFQPSHIYSKKGSYPIKLEVTSSEGCVLSNTINTTIHVANFSADFSAEGPFCRTEGIVFNNTSAPTPINNTWELDNGDKMESEGHQPIMHAFQHSGNVKVRLDANFGKCIQSIEKTITINNIPDLKGFVMEKEHDCGTPVKVNFRDTTAGAVSWLWNFSDYYYNKTSTTQASSFTYESFSNHHPLLTVTNAAGCKAKLSKSLSLEKPKVIISSPDDTTGNGVTSCGSKNVRFNARCTSPGVTISSYRWNFGDGAFGTDASPVHLYDSGSYRVKLVYKLSNGCEGETEYDGYVAVRRGIKANFRFSETNICGNNLVTVFNESAEIPYTSYYFDFGDGNIGTVYRHDAFTYHQYQKEGIFTVKLIATDQICADTMIKTNYVTVKPPFPKITGFTRTCEGDRGEITFTQASKQTDTWTWDFGDGTIQTLTTDQPAIKHHYKNTGYYHVFLTNKNGACTVKDSVWVEVLKKQYPRLSATENQVCSSNDPLNLKVTNLELHAVDDDYRHQYNVSDWLHSDGSRKYATGNDVMSFERTDTTLAMSLINFDAGKEGFRIVIYSGFFGCTDTTNTIPLKITGPSPQIQINNSRPCIADKTIYFQDVSKNPYAIGKLTWEWSFGDGEVKTYPNNSELSHQYMYDGLHYVTVKVTDAKGCYAIGGTLVEPGINSLSASFSHSETIISPGSEVYFYNTTASSDPDNTKYKWLMGDGTVINTAEAAHLYSTPGKYKVTLIASNPVSGCIDSASTIITVKFVNAEFSYSSRFLGNTSCPPVLISFVNNSQNFDKLRWNFGDGTIVEDVVHPNHIYSKGGKYYITLETWSDNGTLYTTRDSIEIKTSSATLDANKLHSCASQQVTLNTLVENVSSYLWDFGDGTVIQAEDSFAHHFYKTPGIYNPRLIYTDLEGCASVVKLKEQIIIDSLYVSLKNLPSSVCSPKEVLFVPEIESIAGSQSPQNLSYHWTFGTGNPADTSDVLSPYFNFDQPGTMPVSLVVKSAFGCVQSASKNISIYQGLGASISGPAEICEGTAALFNGATQIAGQPKWKWIFPDGSGSQLQNPGPVMFNSAGNYLINLVVDNNGCSDTISRNLIVQAKPVIRVSEKELNLCKGSQVTMSASGGIEYLWDPATGTAGSVGATISVSPSENIVYHVTGKNAAGCIGKDSVKVNVIQPFNVQLASETFVCKGKTVNLNASGADTYVWTDGNETLNNAQIATPVATPQRGQIYTVIGSDKYNCFKDTAQISVSVIEPPLVNAGRDTTIFAGSSLLLVPQYSGDSKKFQWTPDKYLSCSDCASPTASPDEPITYTLTVTNGDGCTVSDDIVVNLLCGESRIHIPNMFTPNGDGKNDVFAIRGQGVREIRYLRIYNRFGQLIFEKRNFGINDPAGAWDATFKGKKADVGTYIYMAEMSCGDQSFTRKGTVTITY